MRVERLANRASLGVHVGTTGSRRDTLGVFVVGVDDDGPAARAGIIEGARIAAINGTDLRVGSADADDPVVASARVRQLSRALRDVKPGDEVELRVWQNGQYRTARVRTVPADSLRRTNRTIIIGDGAAWPALLPAEPLPPIPPMPPAGLLDEMRFRLH
jgi:predicted metalloprotease with PDZ domain